LLDGELSKYRRFLWEVGDALTGTAVHGLGGKVYIVQKHLALVGAVKAHYHIKDCRLACTVGAEQPGDFPVVHRKVHATHNFLQPKAFSQFCNRQRVGGVVALVRQKNRALAEGRAT
jgi:hypothetical protein